MAMNEFQRMIVSILSRQDMNVSDLAEHTGYDPLLLENIIAGKSRRIPVDFFIRTAEVLGLNAEEQEALMRSWAFGIEHWSWPRI